MGRFLKWLGLLVAGIVVALLGAGLVLVRRPPEFYVRALEQPPEQVHERAQEFMRHASQLASDVENRSHWEGAFRQEDVNAWLGDAFMQEFAELLPPSMDAPRVGFEDDRVVIAFRKGTGWLAPVISVSVSLWVPEPNLLAIQWHEGRAGAIPVSLASALREAAARSAKLGWDIQWKQHQGNPVALVRLDWEKVCENLELKEIRVEQNFFYVAGTSEGCDSLALPASSRQALRLNPMKPPSTGF